MSVAGVPTRADRPDELRPELSEFSSRPASRIVGRKFVAERAGFVRHIAKVTAGHARDRATNQRRSTTVAPATLLQSTSTSRSSAGCADLHPDCALTLGYSLQHQIT